MNMTTYYRKSLSKKYNAYVVKLYDDEEVHYCKVPCEMEGVDVMEYLNKFHDGNVEWFEEFDHDDFSRNS